MTKAKRPEDLSEQELRRLLLEKRRVSRQERLERYRRTGRAITLAPDLPATTLDDWQAGTPEAMAGSTEAPKPSRRRRITDRFLLGVEIVAILGLAGVLFNGLGILNALNRELTAALRQPTMTATPLITAVVLPSGHTAPDSAGGPRENQAEIPEHLLPLVQSYANLPIPTPGPEQAVRIQIPVIDVDAPVVQGDNWEQLMKGVGQHIGSANPGQNGNLVLSGHNDIYGEIFRYLEELKPGDTVLVYTNQRQFVYVVTESEIVPPTQVEVLDPTSDATLTLITCHPYRVDNKRLVVTAKLQNP